MLKLAIKHLLKKPHDDNTTNHTRLLILEKIDNTKLWQEHKSFFSELVNYYSKKNKFTETQLNAMRCL